MTILKSSVRPAEGTWQVQCLWRACDTWVPYTQFWCDKHAAKFRHDDER